MTTNEKYKNNIEKYKKYLNIFINNVKKIIIIIFLLNIMK
jgi:hypothetical protein